MTILSQTIAYAQNGASQSTDNLGMREMQRRVYDKRDVQHLLIKSPPASGKSRALMFLALDKIHRQGVGKVIVAVPERSIGGSFGNQTLSQNGFAHDWTVAPQNDLCNLAGSDGSKIERLKAFLISDKPEDQVIVCTHATLRHAWDKMSYDKAGERKTNPFFDGSAYKAALENSLVAIDEFHHSSASDESRLGELVRDLLTNGKPHIAAMTGSYFRGDRIPVLRPEDEERFSRVIYTYYEQLSGYQHLRTLGLDYHFYHGEWTDSISAVLNTTKKTIIHIPSVNSATSTGCKINEVNKVLTIMGTVVDTDRDAGIVTLRTPDERIIRVADLVTEESQSRTLATLRNAKNKDDVDVVIALGMAKEGFDWIWCEHAITVGARGSLTEIVQIIGRTTRDAPGKPHAQFTNLIAEPMEGQSAVRDSVNNYLKAIAASLLMEQVMAPNFAFRTRAGDDTSEGEPTHAGIDMANLPKQPVIDVIGLKPPTTDKGRQAIANIDEIEAAIIADPRTIHHAMNPGVYPPDYYTSTVLPEIVREKVPGLDDIEAQIVVDHALVRAEALRRIRVQQGFELEGGGMHRRPESEIVSEPEDREEKAGKSFLDLTRHMDVGAININLIRDMNPWRDSYAIRSKQLSEDVLKAIHETIRSVKVEMTDEEAAQQFPRIQEFVQTHGRKPTLQAESPIERRLAEALAFITRRRREMQESKDQRVKDAEIADKLQ